MRSDIKYNYGMFIISILHVLKLINNQHIQLEVCARNLPFYYAIEYIQLK